MGKAIAVAYGVISYFVFFVTFLYAIGFVEGHMVQKDINSGALVPASEAIIVNLVLMSIFAIQHSVMARPRFKRWWTKIVPASVERSTYVLLSSLALVLLYWQWRPMPQIVWQIGQPALATAVLVLSLAGWLVVLISTFLISHFELFGLSQVFSNLAGKPMPASHFEMPLFYKFVRHPIYLGFIVAFWAAPTMTQGRLLFAGVTTAYIIVATVLEERDLVTYFGDTYRRYQTRVPMLFPWRGRAGS